jgi:hypothetical protein
MLYRMLIADDGFLRPELVPNREHIDGATVSSSLARASHRQPNYVTIVHMATSPVLILDMRNRRTSVQFYI